jgi:type IV secretion system protein VirD4
MRRALVAATALTAIPAAWMAGASFGLCALQLRTDLFVWPYTQWINAARYVWPRRWQMDWMTEANIVLSAAFPTLAVLAIGVIVWRVWRTFGGRLRLFADRPEIERGDSNNHGRADYMSIADMQELFPPVPDDEVGGIVVGEADRVDLGPAAGIRFDPDNRATWGNGGKAPLLIDPCVLGSTQSMVIGGSGTYKSTTLTASLLTWTKSIFCLDPSEELADLVGAELAAGGRKVVRLEIGGGGPNVLAGIDINDPLAETRVESIVGRITGPMSGNNDKDEKFKQWGRTIILALLADMMWNPAIPAEMKTLRTLRDGLTGGMEAVRNRLRGIADHSHSPLARDRASTMWDMVDDTFSGALGNATEDTSWISTAVYGDLVSGHHEHGPAYRMSELAEGNLVVFCQVPQEALEHKPAVARVLVGCHLDAVFAAKGKVNGRVYFAIDEAVLVGRDPALKIARDQGRKSKITLQLFYQSEGQIDEVWTPAGKRAWFDSLSWRTYAGVQNLETARELSATLGTFAARAVSRGEGKTRKTFNVISSSAGENTSEHEISRDLAKPHELLAGMRDDERLTLVRNQPPMRHGAAIAFRRPEMAPLLGETSYRRRHVPDAAE